MRFAKPQCHREEDCKLVGGIRIRLHDFLVRQSKHQWISGAEHFIQTFLQTRNQPTLAKIVVDDKVSFRFQMTLDVFESLSGEEITLQTNVAVAAVQHERIYQSVNDQIIFSLVRTEK